MQFCQGHMKQRMAELIVLCYNTASDICLSCIVSCLFPAFQNATFPSPCRYPKSILTNSLPCGKLVELGEIHIFYSSGKSILQAMIISYLYF